MLNRALVTALITLGVGIQPASADINWQFTSGSNCSTNTSSPCFYSNAGNTRTFGSDTVGGPAVTASAYANTVGSGNSLIDSAYLSVYGGGLGVVNKDYYNGSDSGEGQSPEHAMDNNGRYDSIMFSFASAVQLKSITLGWVSTDSDISVLAYTGASAPSFSNLSYSQLTANGWTVVGNYANVGQGTAKSINVNGVSASYWLIGAYNSVFGLATGVDTYKNDYMKIAALGATTPPPPPSQVPEPHTALLVGIGMLGLLRLRASRRS